MTLFVECVVCGKDVSKVGWGGGCTCANGPTPRRHAQPVPDPLFGVSATMRKSDVVIDPICRVDRSGTFNLKDSGERREFVSGAVRDKVEGKGAFYLLPTYGLLLAAKQMARGAAKYAERNWEKGMPLSNFADSAQRHILKFMSGFDDEPHLDAAIWNLLCLAEGRERVRQGIWPANLDDIPTTFAGKEPGF